MSSIDLLSSHEQIAGQMIMAGFIGTELNKNVRFLIDTVKVGGIILFARNIETPEQLSDLCFSAQQYAKDSGQPPLLIAVDQEGGKVARLKEPFTLFPGNPAIKNMDTAAEFAEITASELKSVGINMNMAPVLDVAPAGFNSVMAERMFGNDPELTAKLGVEIIMRFQQNKIMAVAKHFPGIGRTVSDSHFMRSDQNCDKASIDSFELIPFMAAVKANVAGIMLSHILYTKLDPLLPASLSKIIADDILRNEMGYDGVVMTDDMNMNAIVKHYSFRDAVHRILGTETDMILICRKENTIKTAFEEIIDFIKMSDTNKRRCEKSATRILKMKRVYLS